MPSKFNSSQQFNFWKQNKEQILPLHKTCIFQTYLEYEVTFCTDN